MIQLIHIGKILKSHGKDGQVRVQVDDAYLDDLMDARALFINLDGSKVPFLIDSVEIKNHILVALDEVNQPEEASKLSLKDIYLQEKDISESTIEMLQAMDHSYLKDYIVYDQNGSRVGVVFQVIENEHQDLLEIDTGDQVFLWPFHEDFVIEMDEENEILHINLLDGYI